MRRNKEKDRGNRYIVTINGNQILRKYRKNRPKFKTSLNKFEKINFACHYKRN